MAVQDFEKTWSNHPMTFHPRVTLLSSSIYTMIGSGGWLLLVLMRYCHVDNLVNTSTPHEIFVVSITVVVGLHIFSAISLMASVYLAEVVLFAPWIGLTILSMLHCTGAMIWILTIHNITDGGLQSWEVGLLSYHIVHTVILILITLMCCLQISIQYKCKPSGSQQTHGRPWYLNPTLRDLPYLPSISPPSPPPMRRQISTVEGSVDFDYDPDFGYRVRAVSSQRQRQSSWIETEHTQQSVPSSSSERRMSQQASTSGAATATDTAPVHSGVARAFSNGGFSEEEFDIVNTPPPSYGNIFAPPVYSTLPRPEERTVAAAIPIATDL